MFRSEGRLPTSQNERQNQSRMVQQLLRNGDQEIFNFVKSPSPRLSITPC